VLYFILIFGRYYALAWAAEFVLVEMLTGWRFGTTGREKKCFLFFFEISV
jgi:hypothetical protein